MSIPWSGLNSQSNHIYTSRHRAVVLGEALAYIEADSQIEPPEPDAEATDPTCEACPAGIFYKSHILVWWKVKMGRFLNLARMARHTLAAQRGSVGVEQVFSMARDVIPCLRSGLTSSTISSSMLLKSYQNEELRRELAGHDSEQEAKKLEEVLAVED